MYFPLKYIIEWTSFPGNICDLDLNVYCYDDKARFVEKLDFTRSISSVLAIFIAKNLNVQNSCLFIK